MCAGDYYKYYEGVSVCGIMYYRIHWCWCVDIREQMRLIERGVHQKELRFINRALRCIQLLRKKTNDAILRRVTVAYYPASE